MHIHHLGGGGGHDASRGDLLSCDRGWQCKKIKKKKIPVVIKSSQAAARVRFRYCARVV